MTTDQSHDLAKLCSPLPLPHLYNRQPCAPTWWFCSEAVVQLAMAGTMARAQEGSWGWVCGCETQERDLGRGGDSHWGVSGKARRKLTPGGHLAQVLSEGRCQGRRHRAAAQQRLSQGPCPAAPVWTEGVAAPLNHVCPLRLLCPHLQESKGEPPQNQWKGTGKMDVNNIPF